jgi:hypothetical protein
MVRACDLVGGRAGVESLLRSSESGGCAFAATAGGCWDGREAVTCFGLLCDERD